MADGGSKLRILGAWGPAVAWMALIFFVSALPKLPALPSMFGIDKIQHAAAYLILGLLLYRAAALTGMKPYMYSFTIGALYGAFDEIHQGFVPGRDMSGADWLADILGLAIALLAVAVIIKYRSKGEDDLGRGRKRV